MRVWDPKLTNLKLGDGPKFWPVLPPVTLTIFTKNLHHRFETFLSLKYFF